MKRYAGLALTAIVALTLSVLLIPTGHASRTRGGNEASSPSEAGSLKGKSESERRPKSLLANGQTGQSPTPISSKAVGFALSVPVRELPNIAKSAPALDGDAHEKNALNATRLKAEGSPLSAKMPSIDHALQGAKPIESEAPSAPSLTFDGLSDADNATLIGGAVAPSDENLDVGPNDIVQTINDGFRVWDKSGNPKTAPKLISGVFSKLSGICSQIDNGDPVVLYDRMADRWFITQFAFLASTAPPYHQCVAVSQTGDPLGAYYSYDFVTPGNNFPDYGKFGVWPDGYYMTVNQFVNGASFNGVGMYALDRQKMLAGDPTASFIYFNMDIASFPEGFNSTLPSDQDGLEAPPPGAPNVFAYLLSNEFENPGFNVDALRLYNFHADFANPANSTFIERPESPVAVSAFDPRSPSGRSQIRQPAPAAAAADSLDSIPYHLMYRLQYMNRGGVETLVSSTTVNVSGVTPNSRTTFQAGIRYFQLQRSTPSGPFVLYDNATFSPDAGNPSTGLNRWLPSAAIDHQGDLAVGYSGSSTSVFPSLFYAGRDFNALGGLTGEQTMFAGTAVQLGSTNRWGDYSSLQVDPSDDCTFWFTDQYYNTNSSFNWRTRIGKFKFPSCQAPAQGILSGTITACDSGAPIAGAIVQLSNGFSGTSKADGTYSITVKPGTYTATVTNGLRGCSATSPQTLSVADGSTTTFNTCLSGIANPAIDPENPNPVTIAGGNGNGIIDVDECDTLNVEVKNAGCAPARNVTATLTTATTGVTITQPNSPYADMAIDGTGSNTVPFSISIAPTFTCGTAIDFTLTLTYTGGSTVSTFSLPTCTETQPDQIVSGSVDPGDAKTTAGRIGRNAIASDCGLQKACPGALGAGGRSFDKYTFTNLGSGTSCATITLSSAGGINLIGSSYLNSYDPTDVTFCNNYLGDPGSSFTGDAVWKVDVPAGQSVVVVVTEVNAGTPSTPYSVKVSGLGAAAPAGGGVCQSCTITPPANITVNNDADTCGAIVNFAAPTTTGTCGIVSLSQNSGTLFPIGTTTVTATATSGATATFTVTVNDTQSPVVTAPANISVNTDAGQCSATVSAGTATVSDNCPGANVAGVRSDSQPLNSPYPKGVTTITWTATDASGNTGTAAQTVTVNDTENPTLTVPANIVQGTDPSSCTAIVNYTVTPADNCAGVTVSSAPASGTVFPKGTTTVTSTATDASGNTITKTFTVTVNDTVAPVIACPANIVTSSDSKKSTTIVEFNLNATDNCSTVTVSSVPASGTLFNVGTTPVTATAVDGAGNVSTCTFNVTVNQSQSFTLEGPEYTFNENEGNATVKVLRNGDTSSSATLDYTTGDGLALQKRDYIIQVGTLHFAPGETFKRISIPLINDNYVEGKEHFTFNTLNPVGPNMRFGEFTYTTVFINDDDTTAPSTNPIDGSPFFVQQQYLDFLNRQPDDGGAAFWTSKLTACGSDVTCLNNQRIDVSSAFFSSTEYKDTGFFIYRVYNALLNRQPSYIEFVTDLSKLPASPTIVQEEEAYTESFLQTAPVTAAFPVSQSRDQFIDALLQQVNNAGLDLTSKKVELTTLYDTGSSQINSRRLVVIKLISYPEFVQSQTNPAFVLAQYFGYLRRDPDAGGFQFWLNILNSTNNTRSMVCAFLTSAEYQNRFSSVITRNDTLCSTIAP